jgi:type II secretory pathway pseudopilin PulG
MKKNAGYTIVMLLVVAAVLAVGLLVAVPIWQTQIQRENEEELIFRGTQYVEAIRLYQQKNPGQFPRTLEELYKKRYLRRLYPDPMTKHGKWDVLLQQERLAQGDTQTGQPAPQKLLAISETNLSAVPNALIVGVVSSSPKKSLRLYNDEETYNQWFFYYGQDPRSKPEVIYYGEAEGKR